MENEEVYYKLVRDEVPTHLDKQREKGVSYKSEILSDKDYLNALVRKLNEEATELESCVEGKNGNTKEEIADVLEVIDALVVALGFNMDEIRRIQEEKRNKKGGFTKRIFLKTVTDPTKKK